VVDAGNSRRLVIFKLFSEETRMHYFHYAGSELFCEEVPVKTLVKKYGTPLYVYSQRTLAEHFQKLDRALAPLDHLICFAMKSNSNQAVLRTLADLGGGFDIVSEGELRRALAAGATAAFLPAWARRTPRSSSPCARAFIPSTPKASRNWSASTPSPRA
jgi:hypothetical protein